MTEDDLIKKAIDKNTPDLLSRSVEDILSYRGKGAALHTFNWTVFASLAAAAVIAMAALFMYNNKDNKDDLRLEPHPVGSIEPSGEASKPKGYLAFDRKEQFGESVTNDETELKQYVFEIPFVNGWHFIARSNGSLVAESDEKYPYEDGDNGLVVYDIINSDLFDDYDGLIAEQVYYQDISADGVPELIVNCTLNSQSRVWITDLSTLQLDQYGEKPSFRYYSDPGVLDYHADLVDERVVITYTNVMTGEKGTVEPDMFMWTDEWDKAKSKAVKDMLIASLDNDNEYEEYKWTFVESIYCNDTYTRYIEKICPSPDLTREQARAFYNELIKDYMGDLRLVVHDNDTTWMRCHIAPSGGNLHAFITVGNVSVMFSQDDDTLYLTYNNQLFAAPLSISFKEFENKITYKTDEMPLYYFVAEPDKMGELMSESRTIEYNGSKISFHFENYEELTTDPDSDIAYESPSYYKGSIVIDKVALADDVDNSKTSVNCYYNNPQDNDNGDTDIELLEGTSIDFKTFYGAGFSGAPIYLRLNIGGKTLNANFLITDHGQLIYCE